MNRPTSRTRMLPTDRRTQILTAARSLLESRPIEEVSVESVAKQADVSPGLLFHYFGSQRKFREAVLQAAAEELLVHVRPDPALSLREQLHTSVSTFIDYVTRFPTLYRAVVGRSHNAEKTLHATARKAFADWILTGTESTGAAVTGQLQLATRGWLAYMEEVVLDWIDDPVCTREELIEMCESSFYQLGRAAVGEKAWREIEPALDRTP